jgi:hypothetical protein
MLTRMRIRNFKKLQSADIELADVVVFVGPNNSGKTAALQALALWEAGLRRWTEKRGGGAPEKRPGVAINRRDLISIPVPGAKLLWHNLHVRDVRRNDGPQRTDNVFLTVEVEGIADNRTWACGLEFYYANDESFYCRPLAGDNVPQAARAVRTAFLPPMSGLAAVEPVLEPGRIQVLIGEGQTAQVVRNLCYQMAQSAPSDAWGPLTEDIRRLFGVTLLPPEYLRERGEITMAYEDRPGLRLDLSASGRGLQQTLLLLAHLYANPGTVLLLDEPDAHLEILRQRHVYQLLSDTARRQGGQVLIASHSEVLLNEAADRDTVVAFVGAPHRIDDRGGQVLKSLRQIGFEDYYQAEQTGWVLYLEGATDLAILRAFARTLEHPAIPHLERPFVTYVGNVPAKARDHFHGLREAKPDLVGLAIFDRLETAPGPGHPHLTETMWRRREIENYLCIPEVLLAYAEQTGGANLFAVASRTTMGEVIEEIEQALRVLRADPWSSEVKASDEVLDRIFANYFERMELPNQMRKSDYHVLAGLVPASRLDPEITEKLDAIVEVAERARPRV